MLMGNDPQLAGKFTQRIRKSIGEKNLRRMIFLPHQSVSRYYRYLSASTVLLNSPVYSGEITFIDGLLCEIPSVSLAGELLVQRYPVAYNKILDTEELTTFSMEEYVTQVVNLGTDTTYRDETVRKILSNRQILFENTQCIHGWEQLLPQLIDEP